CGHHSILGFEYMLSESYRHATTMPHCPHQRFFRCRDLFSSRNGSQARLPPPRHADGRFLHCRKIVEIPRFLHDATKRDTP
ncbi:hypothetical protein, partial [Pseudoscardovia radai]|uniref:hypothetical protein n=1 Tax=Pseudoscardovia radai TaxID=987066 RepID=UPI003996B4F3